MNQKLQTKISKKSQVIFLIVILSLVLALAGHFFFKYQASLIREDKYSELKAIADLKVQQIEDWIKQRKTDVNFVKSPFFQEGIYRWLKDTSNKKLKQDIKTRFQQLRDELSYVNIFLLTPNGQVLFSAVNEPDDFDTITKQKINESYQKKEIVFTDLHFCQKENTIHFEIIAPISMGGDSPIAMLLFRRDPNLFLYPLIQSWPTPSQSSETAILRVEKDSVLFLNELRFQKNSALKLKIPLSRTDVPAVQAALGKTGLFEGIDYRGVEVLADIRTLSSTHWIMLSKIDKSEIFSDLRISALIIICFTALLIIICGTGLALINKSRQKNIVMELFNKEKELWHQEERFKVTIDSLGDGVITSDINGNIIYLNNRAEELTGWKQRDARGRYISEIYHVRNEETGKIENNILEKVIKHGIVKELANHTILISKTGTEIAVMDTGAPIYDVDGSKTGIVITFQDETEKRKQQKLIKDSENRLHSTLNNMIEGCQIIDFEWHYLFINKTAEQHNRRPKEELIGKKYVDMWPGIEDTEVYRIIKKCMESRTSSILENEFTFPDGSIGWFELSIEPVPEGILILSDDITGKKRAEINLQKEHDLAVQYFDTAAVIMMILERNGNVKDINNKGCEVLGYSKDEIIGKNWFDCFLPKNNLEEGKDVFMQIIAGVIGGLEFYENPVINRKGNERIIAWHNAILKAENGEIIGILSSGEDVTERKQAEEEIQKLFNLNKYILDNAGEGIYGVDTNGISTFVNQATANMLGYEIKELLNIQMHQNHHYKKEDGTEYPREDCPIYKAFNDGSRNSRDDEVFWRKDGTSFPVEYSSTPIVENEKIIGAVVVFRDISERKKAEKELAESNARNLAILEAIPDLMFRINHEGVFLDYQAQSTSDLYVNPNIIIGRTVKETLPAEIVNLVHNHLQSALQTGLLQTFEYPLPLRSGLNHFEARMAKSGENEVVVIIRNITERLHSEEVIRQSEKKYRDIVETSLIGVYSTTVQGDILYINDAIVNIMESESADEYLNSSILGIYKDPEHRNRFIQALKEEGFVNNFESEMITTKGNIVTVMISGKLDGDIITGMVLDISARKKAEEELIIAKDKAEEANKLKAAFLANMSHEIRTPMIGIIGFSKILTEGNLSKSEKKEYAEEMNQSSKRLLDLINNIILASQLESNQIEVENIVFNLNNLISELYSKYLELAYKNKIDLNVSIELSDENSEISGDEEKLSKILSFLLDNAFKFTSYGSVNFGYFAKYNEIEFFVKDTGIGISEEFLPMIFELFSQEDIALNRSFEGAGIGLTISRGFVELLGGKIWVESQKGFGSTFSFTIPNKNNN